MTGGTSRTCGACGAAVPEAAKFCYQCGTVLGANAAGKSSPKGKWYHNLWFVLVMLFLVLGPFGLPLVWGNPRFSKGVKLALTLAVIAYTIWLVDLTIHTVRAVLEGLRQFNATLQVP